MRTKGGSGGCLSQVACSDLLQEELIKSEEERLTISQALLTMQLDLNHAQVPTIHCNHKPYWHSNITSLSAIHNTCYDLCLCLG